MKFIFRKFLSAHFSRATIICSGALFLFGCADEFGSALENVAPNGIGMISVKSAGNSVILGTNDTTAPLSAQPSMKVSFTYDFALSKHEVTCGEYADVIGFSVKGFVRSYPQTDVTYYDAVIFANLRSKAEGLDTVYTYTSLSRNTKGNCVSLEGLVTHFDRDGYRLPTEAEWTYAASLGWNPKENAWTADNSDYIMHKVCSAGKDSLGFCDLAGNVLEWTDDWLGKFNGTTITNYVGAPDGGTIGERVVKGGSYRNAATNTKLYLRGDIYTVTGAMYSAYVGFRLARGVINNPTWASDTEMTTSKISILAGISKMRSLFKTYRTKLAFRDDATGNIAYVDWASGTIAAREIKDTIDSYHPDISPDGSKVAFCTKPEGISGTSAIYVRNLDLTGTNLVKLNVASAAIPRWRVSGSDTSIVYVTDAGDDSEISEWKEQSTWEVPFMNGDFGTPVKLFDGTFNAGVAYDGKLAVTGSKLLRANMNGTDSVWYGGEQACNASLARDSSKKTIFLDFGGKIGQTFAKKNYEAHERILVANSSGKVIGAYPAPSGYAFDHSEWVLKAKNFAVTSLTDAGGAHSKLAVVNFADSSITELAEGDELWHPCLWVNSLIEEDADTTEEAFVLDLDSTGAYFTSGGIWAADLMRAKMEYFWKMKDTIEYALVGSSRTEDGINPKLITAGISFNMGHPENDLDASIYLAENYFLNHAPGLKAIVISLDLDLWQLTQEASYNLFGTYPGYVYDANHDFWVDSLPEKFILFLENAYPSSKNAQTICANYSGFVSNNGSSWGETFLEIDSTWSSESMTPVTWNFNRLRKFIETADSKGIAVIGVIFPQSPDYRNTGSFGRYGLQRSVAKKMISALNSYQTTYSNFHLMDENQMGDHDYTDAMAINCDHLSATGAAQLTTRLDSLLKTLK